MDFGFALVQLSLNFYTKPPLEVNRKVTRVIIISKGKVALCGQSLEKSEGAVQVPRLVVAGPISGEDLVAPQMMEARRFRRKGRR